MARKARKNGKMERAKCQGIKPDGLRCGAWPLRGEVFCMLHHPDRDNLMLAGSLKTRKEKQERKKDRKDFWDFLEDNVNSPEDVKKLILTAIAEVRSGELDNKSASNISSLAGHLVKVIEAGDLEKKMKYLEDKLKEKDKKETLQDMLRKRHTG